jgi:hypothetical protein
MYMNHNACYRIITQVYVPVHNSVNTGPTTNRSRFVAFVCRDVQPDQTHHICQQPSENWTVSLPSTAQENEAEVFANGRRAVLRYLPDLHLSWAPIKKK